MFEIKNFSETNKEFLEISRIENLINHNSIDHPDDDKNNWNLRDKKIVFDRLLLYDNNILAGYISYNQGREKNKRTCFYTLNIDPKFNHKGYRSLLYNKMLVKVKSFHCNLLHTSIYDHPNYKEHKKFLNKEGFKIVQINREYSCDIRKVDTEIYYTLIQKLEQENIKIYDSKEEILPNIKNFPNHFKKLEGLEWKTSQDIPIPENIVHTRTPFLQWMKECNNFYENHYGVDLVAIRNKEYIGSTDIHIYPLSEPHKAWTGSLGVLRKFRRKGVATALKIKAIEKLLKKGVKEIRTDNEKSNPMFKINLALGFKPVPFSHDYSKTI